ncbi:LLM class flavin-dependent oxidoreductase [Dactylosporangium sp. NPDC000244]|uniref:LLM class flavin-dependent oxidoreductase n=1 Tax=Dactylosporangium sp. NPDC000244 TaxID=3154365 RepID=UPI00331D88B6
MTISRLRGLSVVIGSGKGWESEGWRAAVETARIAESCGFHSIWLTDGGRDVDEVRHNPALVAAAVAVNTRRIRVRVEVADPPASDPLRVAEEWSVVDNLSDARVELLSRLRGDRAGAQILSVRELWSGKPVLRAGPGEEEYSVRTYPAPRRPEPTCWFADLGAGPASGIPPELNAGVFIAGELAVDRIAQRAGLLRDQFQAMRGRPARLAVAAGTTLRPEEVQEIYALGVEELVYTLDIEATRDHLAEAVTELARAKGLTDIA